MERAHGHAGAANYAPTSGFNPSAGIIATQKHSIRMNLWSESIVESKSRYLECGYLEGCKFYSIRISFTLLHRRSN